MASCTWSIPTIGMPRSCHRAPPAARRVLAAPVASGAMELIGKVAVVTGGSGDIGGAICVTLAAAGCDVALTYMGNTEGAEITAAAVVEQGRRAHVIALDQRDEASIDAAVADHVAHFGSCDILVNNAAWNIGIPFKQIEKLDSSTWDRVLETNLRGPFLLSRALAPHLAADEGGRIVNI